MINELISGFNDSLKEILKKCLRINKTKNMWPDRLTGFFPLLGERRNKFFSVFWQ